MTASVWLLALTLRSTLVLAVALGLERLLRRRPAAARHLLLTLAAVGLLLTPALPALLPCWELPLVPRWIGPPVRATVVSAAAPAAGGALPASELEPTESAAVAASAPVGVGREPSNAAFAPSLGTTLLALWLLGVLAALVRLALALRREARLRATTRPLEGDWLDTAAETGRALGLPGTVPLLASEAIETPLTSRWPRPAVLLPSSAEAWPAERRRVVVQHELVHLARGDAWRLLAWRLVAALYWFHPLARLSARHARLVGEEACDEAVLRLGTRPSAYARHLMEIAESLRAKPRRFAGALPMVDRGQLERRLLMILDTRRPAQRGGAVALVCLAVLAALVVAVSAATPASPKAGVSLAVAAAQRSEAAGSACLDSMSGSVSSTIHEELSEDADGLHAGDFSLQQRLGVGRRLCARVHGPVRFDEKDGGIRELPSGSSLLIETRAAQRSQRMRITADASGPSYQWWLNGEPRPADDAARAWLADVLRLVASYREIGRIQGQVGSLQGEIGSIQGEIGALQGDIGEIQGRLGELQGKVGSLQGEQGGLQGEIGGHEGAIGGLEAARSEASAGLRAQLDKEIETHRAAIRKLEAELASGGLPRRMAEAEAELSRAEAASRGQIAELERQIEDLKGDEKVGRLERQIEDIHADERIREIEQRMKPALDRLNEAIQRLGS